MLDSYVTLPQSVLKLLNERADHAAAIAAIDDTLAHVITALSGSHTQSMRAMAELPVTAIAVASNPNAKSRAVATGQTANEFVLKSIQEKKSATSKEINDAWKAAGRNRNADITLSLLTKAKRIKRTPLGNGIRGSRYSIVE